VITTFIHLNLSCNIISHILHINYVNELISRTKTLLGELKVVGLNKKSSAFLGTQTIITDLTSTRHRILSRTKVIQSTPSSLWSLLILSTHLHLELPIGLPPSEFMLKLHVFILIIVQRNATQSSLFIILQVHATCFGCQPHPSSGVHKTVTTAYDQ